MTADLDGWMTESERGKEGSRKITRAYTAAGGPGSCRKDCSCRVGALQELSVYRSTYDSTS
jgi:hypothetical protein